MQSSARPGFVEPLVTYLAATTLASVLFWTGRIAPLIGSNLHLLIACVFLFSPRVASRLSGRPFDDREAGMRIDPVRLNLRVLGSALGITWPLFALGFFLYYGIGCSDAAPAALRALIGPLCARWRGFGGGHLGLPDSFLLLAVSQLVVIAVPEEFFFRGYLMDRLERLWPSRHRLLGAPVGLPLLVSSALFGLGHVLVDFNPQRLAVAIPALVFGWMRARTGSIAAGAAYHASCNLYSDVLHTSFFW